MAKPQFKTRREPEELPVLDDLLLLVGTELEYQGTRYTVECLAETWGDEEHLIVVLRQKLGLQDKLLAVAYEDLVEGGWSNLGL